ncbi:ribosomal protein S3 (nucleomorph) [Bigelowiella natans]|uniref:Ribosomal protein S3 n=1 Tax=Bigelowiella natans TaxID=227086 RepID=Q3LWD3_BIGNA|nr:ribosomal protein S3 [Bigelowiella natans]ABA27232.1 ribosomal protein S3 [Bigelowiella natans]|mmetsp:Transcript_11545/g.16023  ORF Transcript_11545/g.16023 Transcript_11545/m.16023 type:complete len:263 (+) Transcript_11545:21-809(+)
MTQEVINFSIKNLFKIIFKYNRFLKFYLYKKNENFFFVLYLKSCRFNPKYYFSTLRNKSLKILNRGNLDISTLKNLSHIKKFFKKNCRFHYHQKLHCSFTKKLKNKLTLTKNIISHLFFINSNKLKILYKNYKSSNISTMTQSSRMKEAFNYTNKSFRSIIFNTLRFLINSGVRGCMIKLKGVYRSKRTKTFKFRRGLISHSGIQNNDWIDSDSFYLNKKRGTLGINIKIMKKERKNYFLNKKHLVPGKIRRKSSILLLKNK